MLNNTIKSKNNDNKSEENPIMDVLKERIEYYHNENKFISEHEKRLYDEMKEIRIKKEKTRTRDTNYLVGMANWIHIHREMELLYSILCQLIKHLEKDIGKLDIIEKETELYREKGLQWVLQDIHQKMIEKEKTNNKEE